MQRAPRISRAAWLSIALLALPQITACVSHPGSPLPQAAQRPHEVRSPQGTRADPYYWLRDDTRRDPEVLAYLQSENNYAAAMLAVNKPLEEKLNAEMVARTPPDDSSVPYRQGQFSYYRRVAEGEEYPVFARRAEPAGAPEEVVLDINALARGHGFFAVDDVQVSPDGKLVAYAADAVGREQYVIRVRDIRTGREFPDEIHNAEANIAWAGDNRTFLYVEKDPVTLLGLRVKKHLLGTDSATDPLVYEQEDHNYYTNVMRSKSGRYLFIYAFSTVATEYRFAAADDPQLAFKVAYPRQRDHEYQLEHAGDEFIIRTNWQAPNFRLMAAPIAAIGDRSQWREVIAHRADTFIQAFDVFDRYLALNERAGGLARIRYLGWDGNPGVPVAADGTSYVMRLGDNREISSTTLRYTYSSLAMPVTTYDLDMVTGARTELKREAVGGGFAPRNYRTDLLWATARDGTRVPVSILTLADFKPDGTHSCLQIGYGAYGDSYDPEFLPDPLSLVNRNLLFAIAHIRGGQEMGRDWYEQGRLLHKRNTFTDFIDVTRFLVKEGYCAAGLVAARGRSAGGLLMGAVATMAPRDYRVVLAHVPFVDVVTTMLDESIPLTSNEFDEWGDPRIRSYYDYMLAYSPYDNVVRQAYPAMLVTTSLSDSRVAYFEPAKWVAKMRATRTDQNPLLLITDLGAGHSGKSGRYQRFRERAREYAFALQQLGVTH